MKPLRVIVAGGGTGGHLYPGIAVARELLRRRPDALITFAGTARGIESRVIPREGFALDVLRSAGLKGTSPAALARGLLLLPLGGIDAWRILSRRSPDVVIGVGGYSSGPVVLAAAARRIPTLLLEQNAVPGFTNRTLARLVDAAAVTFEETVTYFGRRGFVTGNPVRAEFLDNSVREESGHPSGAGAAPRVLIFGGSQGAHAINVAMVEAAPKLAAHRGGMAITHQTGERDLEWVRDGYRRAGLEARVEPFLFAMDREVKQADLVVSRAGATTIAELTAAGKPALLIPLPTAADDHQRRNAEVLARAGAAEVVDQGTLAGSALADRVIALAGDPARRAAMARAARALAKPDAARAIADKVLELAGA
jgi:UDP-N-acetylglucosamine--N-acetylmuramyl-(pentapeptide) pyrophosphoryl-undecaprenol N-acetylglucosamine transferase